MNRFRWGLCVDVQPPDLETRIAILQLKAERERLTVPHDVIEFVASKFDQSVRELEGALVRVVAWSELTGQPIDQELAERALQDLIPQNEHEIPPPADHGGDGEVLLAVDRPTSSSKSRSRPLTQARHIAMYLMRECTGLSLVKIGEIFGGRDHTTVLHGIKKVEDEMRARDTTFRQVQDLTRIIRAGCARHERRRRWERAPRPVDNLGTDRGCPAANSGDHSRSTRFPHSFPTCRRAALRCGNGMSVHVSTVLLPPSMLTSQSVEPGGGHE